jgi:Spy/CpxP family protein refolding chaperone
MKKSAIIGLTIAIITGATMLIFAQERRTDLFGKRSEVIRQLMFNQISAKLNLTNDQKVQVKTIMENSRKRFQPLVEQLESNHQQNQNLGTDGVYDEQKVKELADEQSEIAKQLILEKEKTKAQLFAILTPEQREQAKKMRDDFESRIKNRFLSLITGDENLLVPDA